MNCNKVNLMPLFRLFVNCFTCPFKIDRYTNKISKLKCIYELNSFMSKLASKNRIPRLRIKFNLNLKPYASELIKGIHNPIVTQISF